jgi:hypothetical protein
MLKKKGILILILSIHIVVVVIIINLFIAFISKKYGLSYKVNDTLLIFGLIIYLIGLLSSVVMKLLNDRINRK